MSKLVLIDGHAILHRAYHALPKTLTTKDSEPINAVYGFVSMLLRVISDLEPTHIAVCFDRKEPTFRKEAFEQYQAHRPEMDEELESQISVVKDVVESFGIPVYEKPGYEADDVIGTIASKATEKQKDKKTKKNQSQVTNHQSQIDHVVIVTGDKDILQLVNDKIHVYLPKRGLSDAKEMEEKDVKKKLKVKPEQIVDYKALVGDPSDNYPGVKGIGPKTAETLLEEFGDLEGIYKFVEKVSNKKLATTETQKNMKALKERGITENVLNKLRENKEEAYLSQMLARIVTDVDIDADFEDMNDWEVGSRETLDVFKEIGFKTLTKRVKEMGSKLAAVKQGALF